MPPATHRVVIVGGGFAGLYAARGLADAPVAVTLVDRRNHHLFQPLLYQVATGSLSSGEIAPPLRWILRRQRNAAVVLADVEGIDLDQKVILAQGADGHEHRLSYDTLVVAVGAETNYFGHDDWAPHAPGLKSIEDALDVRDRVLGAFEAAELEADPAAREAWLTFVVVGGGPTGVELAGQIAELARDTLRRDFQRVDTSRARVILADAAPQLLTSYSAPPPGPRRPRPPRPRRRGSARGARRRRGRVGRVPGRPPCRRAHRDLGCRRAGHRARALPGRGHRHAADSAAAGWPSSPT